MKYKITQTATGIVIGLFVGASEEEALDAYARDAGYRDYDVIPEEIGGGDTLEVEEITDGEAIKIEREAAQMSRAELAAGLGVTYATVQRWETGVRRPGVEHAKAIGDLLGVRVIASGPPRAAQVQLLDLPASVDLDALWSDVRPEWLDEGVAALIERLGFEPDPDHPLWGLTEDETLGALLDHRCAIERVGDRFRVAVECHTRDVGELLARIN